MKGLESGAPRVLIVEDEALIATNLEMILEDAGCEVVGWAADSREARSLSDSAELDVAIVDIQLRGGDDGIDLAGELQAKGIAIVFVTAQADPATIARARQVPHLRYIRKPYRAEAIVAAVRGSGGE